MRRSNSSPSLVSTSPELAATTTTPVNTITAPASINERTTPTHITLNVVVIDSNGTTLSGRFAVHVPWATCSLLVTQEKVREVLDFECEEVRTNTDVSLSLWIEDQVDKDIPTNGSTASFDAANLRELSSLDLHNCKSLAMNVIARLADHASLRDSPQLCATPVPSRDAAMLERDFENAADITPPAALERPGIKKKVTNAISFLKGSRRRSSIAESSGLLAKHLVRLREDPSGTHHVTPINDVIPRSSTRGIAVTPPDDLAKLETDFLRSYETFSKSISRHQSLSPPNVERRSSLPSVSPSDMVPAIGPCRHASEPPCHPRQSHTSATSALPTTSHHQRPSPPLSLQSLSSSSSLPPQVSPLTPPHLVSSSAEAASVPRPLPLRPMETSQEPSRPDALSQDRDCGYVLSESEDEEPSGRAHPPTSPSELSAHDPGQSDVARTSERRHPPEISISAANGLPGGQAVIVGCGPTAAELLPSADAVVSLGSELTALTPVSSASDMSAMAGPSLLFRRGGASLTQSVTPDVSPPRVLLSMSPRCRIDSEEEVQHLMEETRRAQQEFDSIAAELITRAKQSPRSVRSALNLSLPLMSPTSTNPSPCSPAVPILPQTLPSGDHGGPSASPGGNASEPPVLSVLLAPVLSPSTGNPPRRALQPLSRSPATPHNLPRSPKSPAVDSSASATAPSAAIASVVTSPTVNTTPTATSPANTSTNVNTTATTTTNAPATTVNTATPTTTTTTSATTAAPITTTTNSVSSPASAPTPSPPPTLLFPLASASAPAKPAPPIAAKVKPMLKSPSAPPATRFLPKFDDDEEPSPDTASVDRHGARTRSRPTPSPLSSKESSPDPPAVIFRVRDAPSRSSLKREKAPEGKKPESKEEKKERKRREKEVKAKEKERRKLAKRGIELSPPPSADSCLHVHFETPPPSPAASPHSERTANGEPTSLAPSFHHHVLDETPCPVSLSPRSPSPTRAVPPFPSLDEHPSSTAVPPTQPVALTTFSASSPHSPSLRSPPKGVPSLDLGPALRVSENELTGDGQDSNGAPDMVFLPPSTVPNVPASVFSHTDCEPTPRLALSETPRFEEEQTPRFGDEQPSLDLQLNPLPLSTNATATVVATTAATHTHAAQQRKGVADQRLQMIGDELYELSPTKALPFEPSTSSPELDHSPSSAVSRYLSLAARHTHESADANDTGADSGTSGHHESNSTATTAAASVPHTSNQRLTRFSGGSLDGLPHERDSSNPSSPTHGWAQQRSARALEWSICVTHSDADYTALSDVSEANFADSPVVADDVEVALASCLSLASPLSDADFTSPPSVAATSISEAHCGLDVDMSPWHYHGQQAGHGEVSTKHVVEGGASAVSNSHGGDEDIEVIPDDDEEEVAHSRIDTFESREDEDLIEVSNAHDCDDDLIQVSNDCDEDLIEVSNAHDCDEGVEGVNLQVGREASEVSNSPGVVDTAVHDSRDAIDVPASGASQSDEEADTSSDDERGFIVPFSRSQADDDVDTPSESGDTAQYSSSALESILRAALSPQQFQAYVEHTATQVALEMALEQHRRNNNSSSSDQAAAHKDTKEEPVTVALEDVGGVTPGDHVGGDVTPGDHDDGNSSDDEVSRLVNELQRSQRQQPSLPTATAPAPVGSGPNPIGNGVSGVDPPAVSSHEDFCVYVLVPATVELGSTFLVQVVCMPVGSQVSLPSTVASEFLVVSFPRGSFVSLRLRLPSDSSLLPPDHQSARLCDRSSVCHIPIAMPLDYPTKKIYGSIYFNFLGAPIGQIGFETASIFALEPVRPLPTHAARPSTFLSYAAQDRQAVLAVAQKLQLLPEDCVCDNSCQPESLSQEVMARIDECRTFVLFWSPSAQSSSSVARACQYAVKSCGAHSVYLVVLAPTASPLPLLVRVAKWATLSIVSFRSVLPIFCDEDVFYVQSYFSEWAAAGIEVDSELLTLSSSAELRATMACDSGILKADAVFLFWSPFTCLCPHAKMQWQYALKAKPSGSTSVQVCRISETLALPEELLHVSVHGPR